MADQDIFALWPQIQTELLVLLGRPSVQLQLTVVVIALIVAAVLGRTVQNRLPVRFQNGIEAAGFGKKLIYHLFWQLTTGLLAWIFIQLMIIVLDMQGFRTALINALLRIVVISAQLLGVFFRGERLVNAPVFTLFDNTVSISDLFLITVGFYLWIVGIGAFGQGILHLTARYGSADTGSTQATLTLLRYLLIIIGLAYALFRLNFNTTTIAAISGGLSVGIGFALSTILSNFVSGILLLFERTLHPGDIIEYNGILSTVEMITMRSIRVRTFDNVEMITPNSEFVTAPFTTYTGKTRHIRLRLPIGASYDDDHQHVIKTLLDVATAYPYIMQQPAPEVRLENFGDFSIDYQLYVWISGPMLGAKVRNELHQEILVAFAEQGITIPYPTAVEIKRGDDDS